MSANGAVEANELRRRLREDAEKRKELGNEKASEQSIVEEDEERKHGEDKTYGRTPSGTGMLRTLPVAARMLGNSYGASNRVLSANCYLR